MMIHLIDSTSPRHFLAAVFLTIISCGKPNAGRNTNIIPVPTGLEILNGTGSGASQSTGPSGIIIQSPEGHIIG